MRYAIVESGGKQYRAVEGEVIEVDRLAVEQGQEISLERILMLADGPDFRVGTPTLSGMELRATVVDHIAAPKVVHFRYSPKKRIRVRGGHRQQYTRLRVEFIGGKGEIRKPPQTAAQAPEPVESEQSVGEPAEMAVPVEAPKKAVAKKAATKKSAAPRKAAAKKSSK